MFDQLWGSKSVKENRPLQDRLQKENLPVRRIETKSPFLLTLGSLNGSEDDGVRWSSSYEAVLRERGTHKNPLKRVRDDLGGQATDLRDIHNEEAMNTGVIEINKLGRYNLIKN